jgi:hypothetical protein
MTYFFSAHFFSFFPSLIINEQMDERIGRENEKEKTLR